MKKKEYLYRNMLIEQLTLGDKRYDFLLQTLWKKEFVAVLPKDEESVSNTLAMRRDNNFVDDFGPCRVLEILLYFAIRLEEFTYNNGITTNRVIFFWRLVTNLDLHPFTHDNWSTPELYFELDQILNNWIERRFDKAGNGSPFPLRNPPKDQRKTPMWYQLQAYMIENDM